MSSTKYKEHAPNYAIQSSKNNTKRLDFYKRLQAAMDANATMRQSLLMRKNILDHQRKMNYHNEYDRLRGELGQHILRRERGGVGVKHYTIWGAKRQELEKRVKELEGLGAK